MKKIALLTSLGFASTLMAGTTAQVCPPEPGAPCYTTDESMCQYCLGPEVVNPSVRPYTCNGDWMISVSGLYWTSHQDGMEYAIENDLPTPQGNSAALQLANAALNNLINAEYKNPKFSFNGGFRLGLGYNAIRDGWDISATWTSYCGTASARDEVDLDDNHSLIPLWSSIAIFDIPNDIGFAVPFVTEADTKWKAQINLFDIELGREFWTSQYLTLRPFMGVRIASIKQDFDIKYSGGFLSVSPAGPGPLSAVLDYANRHDFVELNNDFFGVGLRGGLSSLWHLGRGFSLYGNLALSMIYGKFTVDHDEYVRAVAPSFAKTEIVSTTEKFRSTRFITDLSLGVEWATMFNACKNYFSIGLAWEQHLFLNQNQLWRISQHFTWPITVSSQVENNYHQRRGDLDTEGWTLTLNFGF